MTAPLTRREQFALAAMQAMISVDAMSRTHIAQYCVALTDLVLAELDRTAQPEPAAEPEWIEWGGGEQPVNGDAIVLVAFRDGSSRTRMANALNWSHDNSRFDIIRYRVVPS